jgi:hypothetical protein
LDEAVSRGHAGATQVLRISDRDGVGFHELLEKQGWVIGFLLTDGSFYDRGSGLVVAKKARQITAETIADRIDLNAQDLLEAAQIAGVA